MIACGTRNPKFAGSGIVSLQRLVISKGLPKARLQDALEAFNACTDLGLDIQLKILQALPSLLQNYDAELEGELLSSALRICSSLQAAKASTVSGVAAATLQQLVTTVFEKVATEDSTESTKGAKKDPGAGGGSDEHRSAAFDDACRVFRDLALAADERKTKFVQFTALSAESSLELIFSALDANSEMFSAHEELLSIIGANIFPIIIRALSDRLSFSITVRSLRILGLILNQHMTRFIRDVEVALNLCTQALDPEVSPGWKRALVIEVLRGFLADSSHLIEAYSAYDGRDGGKPIVQDLLSSFVRISSEKPSAIGLGQQSTIPTGPTSPADSNAEGNLDPAGGMASVFGSALGVTEVNIAGISAQWSLPKSSCLEQLDKSDAPSLPDTYLYAMVLECLNGFSDSLAKIVLPLTVQHEKSRSKGSNRALSAQDADPRKRARSLSFRTGAVPLNPLEAKEAPYAARVTAVAGLVESCWPAVLATASTFLNAALDDAYFRNLIKAYQRFAQVAGLLRLSTPRDAMMTTLAKAAVPPHILNAAGSDQPRSPMAESPRVFSNSRSLLSVDSLVSQTSSLSMEHNKRTSGEPLKPMLSVRNLLCLRALLNLAIALGPTLNSAFAVVVSALKQADMVLSRTTPQQISRHHKDVDSASVVQAFSAEVAAVESAASRLLESSSDYPNDAFLNVLQTFCKLLHGKREDFDSPTSSAANSRPTTPKTSTPKGRTFSGLPGISTFAEIQGRDYHFVIPKLGTLAELNVPRFVNEHSTASGWDCIVDELMSIARTNSTPRDARRSAANVLVKMAETTIAEVTKEDTAERTLVQRRALDVLLRLVDEIYLEDGDITQSDMEVQSHVLGSLQTILERCGDSLVAGWDRILAIISVAFESEENTLRDTKDDRVSIDWRLRTFDFISRNIGKGAFGATQLVCSDFLDALPPDAIPDLIELLHRFMCQEEDVNGSLTAITISWNMTEWLFNRCPSEELSSFIDEAREFDELEEDLSSLLPTSQPAQWLLMLLRLRDVAAKPLKEIRNAAYQTILNVFKLHGSQLSPAAWDLLLRNTIFHISRADSFLYMQQEEDRSNGVPESSAKAPDVEMSKTIIAGNFDVVAQHLQIIEQVPKLASLWEVFLSMLERYLDVENHLLNAAVYAALSRVLSGIELSSNAFKGPTYRTVSLWLKRFPNIPDEDISKQSNQDAYVAYAEAGEEIYRLTADTINTSQTRTMINNLYQAIRESDGPRYGADTGTLSPLQSRILHLFKSMRTDQPNIAACLITVAAKLATLHHDTADTQTSPRDRPTFVAISSESTMWLQEIILPHIAEAELLDSGALLQAVQSLRRLVESKYTFKLQYKGAPLWHRATTSALALAKPVLDQMEQGQHDQTTKEELWTEFVGIISGMIKGNDVHLVEDLGKVHEDQEFDIASFKVTREVLVPRLGSADLPAKTRTVYTRALFEASLIHQPERGEVPTEDESPLTKLDVIRRGRVKKVPFSLREDLAYVCWRELIILSSKNGGSPEWNNLAKAAAPLLILRLAIPLRAYIADQPLRGHKPQPLSELEELLFCFETIKKLDLDVNALDGGKAHLPLLYPLLVQAVATAGDRWSGSEEVLGPLGKVLGCVTAAS